MPATCLCFFKTGNGSDTQGLCDQIVTKVQMQIPVPAISVDGDASYNFRYDNFSSGGLTSIEITAEISMSYSLLWMWRMKQSQ
jgi:hypothetical protein